jgi:hypothetical protein
MLVVICGDYGRLWHLLFKLQKNNKQSVKLDTAANNGINILYSPWVPPSKD